MVNGMNLKEVSLHCICERCIKSKHQGTSFPKDGLTTALKLLEIFHTDVCRPMSTTLHGGARYFLTFINDFSRKIHVATPALGSRPRQRGYKVTNQKEAQESRQRGHKGAGQEEARESHHILPRV
jgi:hypothetical protein